MDNTLLLAVGALVRQEVNASDFLKQLMDVMTQRLGGDRGTIYLVDHLHQELVSVVAHLPEMKELRVPLDQGIAGYVARHGQIVRSPGNRNVDAHQWSKVDERTGYETQSMLTGPLHHRNGDIMGVVQFLNKSGGFRPKDEAILKNLAAQASALLEETTLAQRQVPGTPQLLLQEQFNRVIGHSVAMRDVFRDIKKVAPTQATVLIRGETGTGKSAIARAIHYNSTRSTAPFVQVDCTTLPETLIENELFGHEKGAYTGASHDKHGQVEAAQGGTLFLDEIGDLALSMQGKLLTLLQDKSYKRVGATQRTVADVRILAATNRNLERLVEEKKFREDLYYRLRVVQLNIPPLRQRGQEDISALIDHFIRQSAKKHRRPQYAVRADAMEMLLNHQWPGNVRELEHCIESAVIFAEQEITPSNLPLPNTSPHKINAPSRHHPFEKEPSLEELEGEYLKYLIATYQGNRSACARVLGIGRNTLLRKLKKHHLD